MTTTARTTPRPRRQWLVPAGLIALTLVPLAAGGARLVELSGGAAVLPEAPHSATTPAPLVLHIVSALLFTVVGAFQFVPGTRGPRPRWHRTKGRLAAPAGLATALTGLWLTFTISEADAALLTAFRAAAGIGMAVAIGLGSAAVLHRDIPRHRAWMLRGYAIGLGAGTQVFIAASWFLVAGEPGPTAEALVMGAGWLINPGVAEWLIRRRAGPPRDAAAHRRAVTAHDQPGQTCGGQLLTGRRKTGTMPRSSVTPEPSDGPDRSADPGFSDDTVQQGKPESLGERLLGSLIDRAHVMPPRLLAPLLAQEIVAVGGRDVTVYLQDYDQAWLRPLPGEGLTDTDPVPVEGSWAGRAFSSDTAVEQPQDDGGVRLFLPMLDGSDRVGVLAFTLPQVDDDDRRLARRLAGLAADMIVTKGAYTDTFFRARAGRPADEPARPSCSGSCCPR